MLVRSLRRAVFLDRDGVLNEAVVRNGRPYPPANLGELKIVPGARDALGGLESAGFVLVGVTNQPDVARGAQRREVVEAINRVLLAALPLTNILVCYHDDRDECECRKPKPGLLIDAARNNSIDLPRSFMIGDRWRDVEAGRRAGCKTIFIDLGYEEPRSAEPADCTVRSLREAAEWILGQGDEGGRAK